VLTGRRAIWTVCRQFGTVQDVYRLFTRRRWHLPTDHRHDFLQSAPNLRIHTSAISVYDKAMSERQLHGKPVSDERIQAWADEAEAGYDVSELPKARRGRPPVGEGPGTVVPVRLDAATLAALIARAEAEGITTRSEAIREAVREWSHVA
jgi:hypothetical protein